ELRTPLTPILMSASAMAEDPPSGEELRRALEMIQNNVELEARLIDDLLDVARINSGRLSLDLQVTDVHAVIRQALEVCCGELAAAGLRLDLGLEADERRAFADPARLQQVFWNLIKNAIKFTPRGGTIAIRTRNEPAEAEGPHLSSLIVEVADTG